jgi:hypothetical protein
MQDAKRASDRATAGKPVRESHALKHRDSHIYLLLANTNSTRMNVEHATGIPILG